MERDGREGIRIQRSRGVNQTVLSVAAGAEIEQFGCVGVSQLRRLIKVTVGEESGVRTDPCAMDFQLDGAVKPICDASLRASPIGFLADSVL